MAVAGMSSSNFAAENLIATIRGEGYSGEGLSQQTMNATIAPFFQQMRGAYQNHNKPATTTAGDSHTNKIAHTETGGPPSGTVRNSHIDGSSEAKLSTGHQVRQANEIDVANKNLAAMEMALAKGRANMSAEQIAGQEQQIKAVKESLQNSLLKDAGELISTSLGIDKGTAEKLARDIGVNLVPAQDNLDAQGMFSSAKGQVDLYVGEGSTDTSRPSQTNIHEFAHFIDAARYQALAEANPKLFIETLASDALTGSFSKGTARIEKSVFGEDTFERQPINGNKGFSEADAKFAREQIKAYLTENFKDGKLPGVPDDRTLYRFLGTRGAEFPGADFSRNQALLHEMRREISNIRVTYSNVALADQALAKPAVRTLVDAARQSLGANPTKEQYLNALAGVSDATIGLTRGATDYYDFGSRYENRANRFQYSKALEQSLADTHKLVKQLSADSNLAKPDSAAGQFIKQLSDAASNDSKSAALIEMLKSPNSKAALHELTTNAEIAPALRETAKALISNLETVSESTKALKFITALDMVARDAAKIKLLDQEANQSSGVDPITRAQLEASKNQWLDSAFANVPEGEASRLASYMMKRGYITKDEMRANDSPRPDTRSEERFAGSDQAEAHQGHLSRSRPDAAGNWTTDLPTALNHLESERNRIVTSKEFRIIEKGGDRTQLTIWQHLTSEPGGVLSKLKAEGRISSSWEVYPTETLSPLDKVGGDFLLVNTKTGELHFLDATSNSEKMNVFKLRADGVIFAENKWFDQSGAPKIDDSNQEVAKSARDFIPMLRDKLIGLIEKGTPFQLGEGAPPLPSLAKATDAEAEVQQRKLVTWARQQGEKSKSDQHKLLWKDMADVIERGATKYSSLAAKRLPSDYLRTLVEQTATVELVNFALARLDGSSPKKEAKEGTSNVSTFKDEIQFRKSEDTTLTGGSLQGAITKARANLMDDLVIARILKNDQLKELGADLSALKGLTGDERLRALSKQLGTNRQLKDKISKIRNVLQQERDAIESGQLPIIAANTVAKLRLKSGEQLEGIAAKKADETKPSSAAKAPNLDETLPESIKALRAFEIKVTDPAKQDANIIEAFDLLHADNYSEIPEGERVRLQALRDAYNDKKHANHAKALKELHELLSR